MPTHAKENKERSHHSAWYLILIFLVCVAVCGVFFSMGFVVGYNERGPHSAPMTEILGSPPAVPPTVNTSADGVPSGGQQSAAGASPEAEVLPPGGDGENTVAASSKSEAPAAAYPAQSPGKTAENPAAGLPTGGINLQVVALRTKPDAEALVSILKGRGYSVFLVSPPNSRSDDNLYRVLVGPFKTREDAEKVRSKLVQDGFKPFIRH